MDCALRALSLVDVADPYDQLKFDELPLTADEAAVDEESDHPELLASSEASELEELELELIDAGLEEIEQSDDTIYAYADYKDFGTLSKALEDKGIEVTKANLQRLPTTPVEYSEEQLVDIEKMLDKLEDDDDVQEVFTNIA